MQINDNFLENINENSIYGIVPGDTFEQQKQKILDCSDLITPAWRRKLNFLIRTENDLNDFMANFWAKNNYSEIISVSKYHQHKLKLRNMQEDEFVDLYQTNPSQAVIELFMDSRAHMHCIRLEQKIKAGKITLEKLFNMHKQYPKERIGFLLGMAR